MTGSCTQGIKTVLHPVSDLTTAKEVYTALLGVPPQTDESCYVGFEGAGQHIGLVPGGGPQGMTSPVAYWHVPDLEAKLAEVTARGCHRERARARRRWRPSGGHRHRPRWQRPRAASGPMSADPPRPRSASSRHRASTHPRHRCLYYPSRRSPHGGHVHGRAQDPRRRPRVGGLRADRRLPSLARVVTV